MIETQNLFESVIGQEQTKKKLGFYLNAYNHTKIFPNLLFCAKAGQGKSLFSREVAKNLIEFSEDGQPIIKPDGVTPKKKTFLEINASTIKNVKQFVNSILVPHCVDKNVTVFIDEASELKEDVTMSLLTLLNPNANNVNTFVHDEYQIDIDFKRQTFLFATTNPENVFVPLKDRLRRIELEAYTYPDLAKIIQKSALEVNFKENVLEEISTCVRSNARQAVQMAADIKTYLCGGKEFGKNAWNDLKQILSIKKFGLSTAEIQILRFLKERPDGSSLNNLSAKTGLPRTALQQDYETVLSQHGLMEIQAGIGRTITGRGIEYLKELDGTV